MIGDTGITWEAMGICLGISAALWVFLLLCPLWLVAAWLLTFVVGFSNLAEDEA